MRYFLFPILLLFCINSYAEVMRVTILGSGTPRPDIHRFSQSILIESNLNMPRLCEDHGDYTGFKS